MTREDRFPAEAGRDSVRRWGAWTGEHALVLASLIGLIVLATWPWVQYFATAFPAHWDPPLHAWKLRWNARHILAGGVLLPDYNGNFFYPHAHTLCFDDLFWLPSFLSAGLYLCTDNDVLVYSLTSLLSWAFSGLCLYALFRALRVVRPAAFFGAAAYCLLPYRIGYYKEFNMQLDFGLPLLLLALLLFARRPGWRTGLLGGIAFWAQAVSALYYAVIAAFTLPFVGIALLLHARGRWRRQSLATGAAVGLAVAAILCGIYLYPYAELRRYEGFERPLSELLHPERTAQALSYLAPDPYGRRGLFGIPTLPAETNLFPGYLLMLLTAGYALAASGFLRRWNIGDTPHPARWRRAVRGVRLVSVVLVFATAATCACNRMPGGAVPCAGALLNVFLVLIFLGSLALLAPAPGEREGRAFMRGLTTAAAVAFVLSLGPFLTSGADGHAPAFQFRNAVFLFLYGHLGVLHSIRVTARFAIVVLLFLVACATAFLDAVFGRRPRAGWLVIPLVLALLPDGRRNRFRFDSFVPAAQSPALRALAARPGLKTVLALPIGDRYRDARDMLRADPDSELLVNGWSGFRPYFTAKLARSISKGEHRRSQALLRLLWPNAVVLVDRARLAAFNGAGGYDTAEQDVATWGSCLARDERYAVYDLAALEERAPRLERVVRGDLLRAHPVFTFEANPGKHPARLFVTLDGALTAAFDADADWHSYRIPLSLGHTCAGSYETVEVTRRDAAPWSFRAAAFGHAGGAVTPEQTDIPALFEELRADGPWPGWLDHVDRLSADDTALSARFANGVELHGVRLGAVHARPGNRIPVRWYWRVPPGARRWGLCMFVHLRDPADRTVSQDDHLLLPHLSEADTRYQPYPKLFTEDGALCVPADAPPGRYRVVVGLVEQDTRHRLPVRSRLPTAQRAVTLPVSIAVATGGE